MSSNEHIKRAPKNPLSDEQYEAKYGKPRKCLHCTNSNKPCSGGRPCGRCENSGRVCTDVITKLPCARPGSDRKKQKISEPNNENQTKFGDNEDEDRQVAGYMRAVDGQGANEHMKEDSTGVLGYAGQELYQGSARLAQTPYQQPTHLRAEDELVLIQARDRDIPIHQPQFPSPPPQRVSMTAVIPLRVGFYPQDAVRYFHDPGLYGPIINLENLERAPGGMRDLGEFYNEHQARQKPEEARN